MEELHDFQTTLALVNDGVTFQISEHPVDSTLCLSITDVDEMLERTTFRIIVHKKDLMVLVNHFINKNI